MVRTKADAATRVAAGGKAPKKSLSRAQSSPLPSSSEKGKDNLPGNRYCPRETPAWQRKITFFYDKNSNGNEATTSQESGEVSEQNTKDKLKRSNLEIDEINNTNADENESSPKKSKNSNGKESNIEDTNTSNESEEPHDESMETDE